MSFRFASADRPDVAVVTPEEQDAIMRRLHDDNGMSCCKTLHVGIFFDGTRNNADRDRAGGKHSNVARLFDVFPRDKYHSAIYVAGVGTPFVDEVGDQGVGLQAAAGAATPSVTRPLMSCFVSPASAMAERAASAQSPYIVRPGITRLVGTSPMPTMATLPLRVTASHLRVVVGAILLQDMAMANLRGLRSVSNRGALRP